jgi:sugar/nucleoside kinase (ribokinase family)
MKPIVTIGDALVEIMRSGIDQPLDEIHEFRGPYPSGAPAIFADAVGRLGIPSVFIGAVGNDAFGRCISQRLAGDGVDVSGVRVIKDRATGVAFVMYRSDGSRQFIFHAGHAASGQVDKSDIKPDVIQGAAWLHISGTALTVSESCRAATFYAVDLAVDAGVPISFDPNIRVEMLGGQAQARALCDPVLRTARVILPTLNEARGLTGRNASADPATIAHQFLQMGIAQIVIKNGEKGCIIFTSEGRVDVPGFAVQEVDPTGAGDCFSAGYLAALMRGSSPVEAGRYANAVGALSVTRFGPMEGNPTHDEVQRLLSTTP